MESDNLPVGKNCGPPTAACVCCSLIRRLAGDLAVALVALAVFLTVRMQMQSSLDQSLLDRARQAATAAPLLDEA